MTVPEHDSQPEKRRPQRPLPQERHRLIVAALEADGAVHVSELAPRLAVSEMTIRRDLVELERGGLLTRTHGGALPVATATPVVVDEQEPTFAARLQREHEAKAAIAAMAARMVRKCRATAIDVGTTTYRMADFMDLPRHAKVFTNSVRLAGRLVETSAEIYLAGGKVRPIEQAVVGPTAIAQFERLWFDIAIIGVAGITPNGLFDYAFEEVDVKRVYIQRAQRRVVLCDASKFHRVSLVQVAQLHEVTTLITNAEPPADLRAALDAARVDVRIAPPVVDPLDTTLGTRDPGPSL
ncbi:DeoR/GlpR family DNA-binding transcription regulator [Roseospira goensis]|uniref:DeoR family glycerol-3-phosphate regulon repressor n=1 Tax=Roseospira goensis TaxID=391922 RepID=A0A7W6RZB5_9PROT|nr:DeoR/GlpR family DNA-binding transcription regulator [Roseospira goensis]MBB4285907.1 DeoR family glycerol-3-phosphate regulon repressor [Roseospira goensis]